MKDPLIGILMATYNGEKFISQQIQSILNQTYKNWKLIIHDDGSNDSTINIIKKFVKNNPYKIFFVEDRIKCGGAKENFAHLMQIAKEGFNFDYIMFSDQDDVWFPKKVEISLKKMQELETKWGKNIPLLVYTDLEVVNENLKRICSSFWKYQRLNPSRNALNYLLIQNVITGCTTLINMKTLEISLPIPKQAIMHDWWIALVVSAFGKMDFISTPTVFYRQHNMQEIGAKKWNIIEVGKKLIRLKVVELNTKILNTVLQAETFLETYQHILDAQKRELLITYSKILTFSFLSKIYFILEYKFFKHGFLRNIGFLFFILLSK